MSTKLLIEELAQGPGIDAARAWFKSYSEPFEKHSDDLIMVIGKISSREIFDEMGVLLEIDVNGQRMNEFVFNLDGQLVFNATF